MLPPNMGEFLHNRVLKINKSLHYQVITPKFWYDNIKERSQLHIFKS